MVKKSCILFSGLLLMFFASFGQSECNLGTDTNGDGLPDCSGDAECQFAPTIERGCNCIDGTDNDGDGKTDLDDSDCADYFGLTFVGEGSDCSIDPPPGTMFFDISEAEAVSGQNTVDTQSKMAIGDVDGDGIPDIMTTTKWNTALRLIHTVNSPEYSLTPGDVKALFNIDNYSTPQIANNSSLFPELEIMIADIDHDGFGEIFATISERTANGKTVRGYFLVGLDYVPGTDPSDGDFALMWNDIVKVGDENFRPGIMGIADFDGDGKGELYLKDRIYAAETGELIATGNGGDWLTTVNSAPVAVNILGDNTMELISGNIIYDVNPALLASRTMQTLTVAKDMNALPIPDKYFPKTFTDLFEYGSANFSSTSVADVDKDGSLDVFMSGAKNGNSGQTSVFYWNVAKATVGIFEASHPDVFVEKNDTLAVATTVSFPKGWIWGTGRVNLGDLDGDGMLEASFIAGNQLWALEAEADGTLSEKWRRTINDSRSGIIANTVYDFDNDAQPELIYRDSQVIAIIDGTTGSITKWSSSCQSHTLTEGPIIADVNGDGATDICVPCFRGSGGGGGGGNFKVDDQSQEKLGEIRLYNSTPASAWLPTRQVWNQPGYFVVNINDDLTLPFPQLDQTLNFGDADCGNGLPGPQWPFNVFLNQVPSISATGCPIYPAPDIAFAGIDPRDPAYDPTLVPGDPGYIPPTIEVFPPICGDLEITVNFNITNDGSRIITDDIPVSFWDVDPTVNPQPANRLHTVVLPVTNFQIGEIVNFSGITFNSTGKAFTLYIVLNDDTYADPVAPIVLEATSECKVDNNIYEFPIEPRPFEVRVDTKDNNKCNDTFPDDGWLDARVFESTLSLPPIGPWTTSGSDNPDWEDNGDWSGPAPDFDTNQSLILTRSSTISDPIVINDGDTLVIESGATLTTSEVITVKEGGTLIIKGKLVGTDPGKEFKVEKAALYIATGASMDWAGYWTSDDLPATLAIGGSVTIGGDMSVKVTISGPGSISVGGLLNVDNAGDIFGCTDKGDACCQAPGCTMEGGSETTNYGNYGFQWYTGRDTSNPIPAPEGTKKLLDKLPGLLGVPEGEYTVVVTNLEKGCTSLPLDTMIIRTQFPPVITVNVLDHQTICSPENGKLEGIVAGGNSGYLFRWYDVSLGLTFLADGITTIGGLAKGSYQLSVDRGDGCGEVFSDPVSILGPEFPDLTTIEIADIINCDIPDAGVVSAQAFFNAVLQDSTLYTFEWRFSDATFKIDGSVLPPQHTEPSDVANANPTRKKLTAGIYAVRAIDNSTQCASAYNFAQVENLTKIPELSLVEVEPQTSCDPNAPNGKIRVDIAIDGLPQDPSLFTIEWFKGDNTLPENKITTVSGTNGEIAEGIGAGGIPYTVKVTSNNDCFDTDKITISETKIIPTITATPFNNSICDPAIATSAEFNGRIETSVTYDGNPVVDFTDFTFTWYEGIDIVNDPPIAGETGPILDKIVGGNRIL